VENRLVIGSFSTGEKNCCDEQEIERRVNVRVREQKSVAKEDIVLYVTQSQFSAIIAMANASFL
jgi:hypothetical protein